MRQKLSQDKHMTDITYVHRPVHGSNSSQTNNQGLTEALSVLMLCTPCNHWQPFSYQMKITDFEYFHVLSVF